MIHEGGKPVRVLEAKDLEEISEGGKIEWPAITKEEIADRSKGDYLSKMIVLFQTTWFIGQCISRGASGLTITELEVVTIAFASLTGVIYYLWWDKPLDVRCSIPVRLLPDLGKIEGDIKKEEIGPQIILSPKVSDEEIHQKDENVVVNPNSLPTTSIQLDISTPDRPPTRMQRFQAFIRGACKEYGTLFGLGYVFIGFPLKRFFDTFGDLWECTSLGDKSLQVPTFYSPYNGNDDNDTLPYVLAICVVTVFGAIHCIPWAFYFAALQERCIGRILAILVSVGPICLVAVACLPTYKENQPRWMQLYQVFEVLIIIAMIFLYIIARIVLLAHPFVALRALPPGAYIQLNGISLLPHI